MKPAPFDYVAPTSLEAAVHALMLDPLTAAVCTPAEIRQLFDEMAATQKDYLPHFINLK